MAVSPFSKGEKKKINLDGSGGWGRGTVLMEPAEMNTFKLWYYTFRGGQFLKKLV